MKLHAHFLDLRRMRGCLTILFVIMIIGVLYRANNKRIDITTSKAFSTNNKILSPTDEIQMLSNTPEASKVTMKTDSVTLEMREKLIKQNEMLHSELKKAEEKIQKFQKNNKNLFKQFDNVPGQTEKNDSIPLRTNIHALSIAFRQIKEKIITLKEHSLYRYNATDVQMVGEKLRWALRVLDLWELINLSGVTGRILGEKNGWTKIIDIVKDALQEAERKDNKFVGVTVAEYDMLHDIVQDIERSVFYWISDDISVLQLKNSFIQQKGLVMTMGNHQFYSGFSTVRVLRERGCLLPIEVFFLGENDLSEKNRASFKTLGNITIIDLYTLTKNRPEGWACKPFVILFSSFREVVFIDSDAHFVQPLERVFKQPGYLQNGALFFQDRSIGTGISPETTNWIRDIMPGQSERGSLHLVNSRFFQNKSAHMMESGVVVIDKYRHFGALLAVCQLNLDLERKMTYKVFYGDKETFWLAFEIVGDQSYSFSPYLPGVVGPKSKISIDKIPHEKYIGQVCSSKILHLDANAQPFWFNGGLLHSKFMDENLREFEVMSHWNVEPGYWELKSSNIGCLYSKVEARKVGADMAEWIRHHQLSFMKLAQDSMPNLTRNIRIDDIL